MALVGVPKEWDGEADVIVVGGGTSGLPAAIIVAEARLKATILESRAVCGGSFNMVVGGMAFAGTDEQREAGMEDSPDIFYKDMRDICGTDPEIARAYADNQLDAYIRGHYTDFWPWPAVRHQIWYLAGLLGP